MDNLPTAPIIERRNADAQQLETAIMLCWQDYKVADSARNDKGLSLGKACYELREQTKAQGSRSGDGFTAALKKNGIPKRTAYRWISRYEESAGLSATWHDVHAMPELDEEKAIIGSSGDLAAFIEPSSTHPGYFYVTLINRDSAIAEGGIKPIRADFATWCLDYMLERATPPVARHEFMWRAEDCNGFDHNRWLTGQEVAQ